MKENNGFADDEQTEKEKYKNFTDSQIWVLEALKESLTGKISKKMMELAPNILDTLNITLDHSIAQLVENQTQALIQASEDPDAARLYKEVEAVSSSKTMFAMRQIFLTKKLADAFATANIQIAILKGIATGRYYGKPEKRKAGDVDVLLLEPEQIEKAKEIVLSLGCQVKEEQKALHHIVFLYLKTNITVELHTMLVEPFDNTRMNEYVDQLLPECRKHIEYVDAFGVRIPALTGAFHAYELLIHMLQHFLRAGFGLKLLCDWVVFWEKADMPSEEKTLYMRLVRESGIKGFSDMITLVCMEYLGVSPEKVQFMDIDKKMDANAMLHDIFEGQEFGHSDSSRMVALRGSSPWDYIREFHHQMRLNHPRCSKCVLTWPVLWVVTYVVFIRNNKKIRGTSASEVYRKAGRRGRIVKEMRLFR